MKKQAKYKWNLKKLLDSETEASVEKDLSAFDQAYRTFINKWETSPRYLEDPEVLRTALDDFEHLVSAGGTGGNAGYYFSLKGVLNQSDPKVKAVLNRINERSLKLTNDIQFFTYKLSKIPYELQVHFLNYPGLLPYRHYLELLFAQAKYLLTEPEEKILNLKGQTSYGNWVKMVSDFLSREERFIIDASGKRSKKTMTEIRDLLPDPDKKVRDAAAKAFNDILEVNVDVAENELNSILQDKKVDDDLRKVQRPDLARHVSDDIDPDVVDSMLDAVVSRFDIPAKFYELKSRVLGLPALDYHETNVQYGDLDKKTYTFEETTSLVSEVFSRLDPEFTVIFSDYVKQGQIDVYPSKGKDSSEFCVGGHLKQPGYILLNFNSKLEDVITLSHEMGHAINNELIRKSQNALNFDTPLCTAEVASTFMEDFVLDRLGEEAGEETKFALLMRRLNDDVATIFRQVACYKFEQELHAEFRKQGYLPKEEIGRIFLKHMASYMGPYVKQNDGSVNWWVHWSHIRSYFYVYSYASGSLISKALQSKVKADKSFIPEVKKFLSAGTSKSPKAIFMDLGIDITKKEFWEEGLCEIEKVLTKAWAQAEALGKIQVV